MGKSKFQKTFEKHQQKIIDMHIFRNPSEFSTPVYQTDFTLLDNQNRESQYSIHEREVISNLDFDTMTSYQTLCYSYLNACQVARYG